MNNKKQFFVGNVADFSKRKGWFFGHFADEELLKSDLVEVAWQEIKDKLPQPEDRHYHTGSVEINIVISGEVMVTINDTAYQLKKGEFYIVWPEEVVDAFEAKDAELIVLKAPSFDDKDRL